MIGGLIGDIVGGSAVSQDTVFDVGALSFEAQLHPTELFADAIFTVDTLDLEAELHPVGFIIDLYFGVGAVNIENELHPIELFADAIFTATALELENELHPVSLLADAIFEATDIELEAELHAISLQIFLAERIKILAKKTGSTTIQITTPEIGDSLLNVIEKGEDETEYVEFSLIDPASATIVEETISIPWGDDITVDTAEITVPDGNQEIVQETIEIPWGDDIEMDVLAFNVPDENLIGFMAQLFRAVGGVGQELEEHETVLLPYNDTVTDATDYIYQARWYKAGVRTIDSGIVAVKSTENII